MNYYDETEAQHAEITNIKEETWRRQLAYRLHVIRRLLWQKVYICRHISYIKPNNLNKLH